jgi:hypothetical protein
MQMILADNFSTSSATKKPQLGRNLHHNLRGGMPVRLDIKRGAVATPAGAVTIYGANVPNPWANRSNSNLFRQRSDVTDANLVASDYQFLSTLDYVAFSNYNWIALLDEFAELVVEIGATLGAVITSGTGTKARLDFTAETDTGDGATLAFTLASDYNLLDHCNLQVQVGGVVKTKDTDFVLSEGAGGKTLVTFTAAPANLAAINYQLYPKPSKTFGLAFVTVATLKAAAIQVQVDEEIVSRDAMWLGTGAGVTGTITANIKPLGVGA